ncbi:MAG TPA: xanthine dehydrogenase family protein subunit M [Ktedonobacteraceae bacterium]|nr:xanthine dehydrogenase family protein subunit M [Ktedonobacteraceae bacterium]
MKPPRFRYTAPTLLEEALTLLANFGAEAKILAGGQSLIPLLNMRLAGPDYLIDINRIAELNYIEEEDGYLAIGAGIRQRQVENSALVRQQSPLLLEAIEQIAHPQIRNRGTIVGSIAHADPAGELPALLTCLRGEVVALSLRGERIIKAQDFFTGYLSTALEPDELLTEVRFPWIPPQAGVSFMEFSRRTGDYALAGIAAALVPGLDDRCFEARVAFLGIAGAPVRALALEQLLIGTELSERDLTLAGEAAAELVSEDVEDIHATTAYRRSLTMELTKRALRLAWVRREHEKV